MPQRLSSYFVGVAGKRLSAVEVDPTRSNQHEFNGVTGLKELLGLERKTLPAQFIYLSDNEEDTVRATGSVTWYDARERHPTRSEYHLYYTANEAMPLASEGDLAIFALLQDDKVLITIARAGSTTANQLVWLFDLPEQQTKFEARRVEGEINHDIGFAARFILEELGIEVHEEPEDENWLDFMLDQFGERFPTTARFSEFARTTLPEIDSRDGPDEALIRWMEREESLFRAFERYLVAKRLREGFGDDVDAFITYSLSVQNRRKSRVGHAFENHLEHIFREHELLFARGAKTENRSRPDFLFPGEHEYRQPGFPDEWLTMLGAKSTCKDRWRQVLSEAARIDQKHLITLEPGISSFQTDEMKHNDLQLVIPTPLHKTYDVNQRAWLIDLREFIDLVTERQEFFVVQ